MFVWKTSVEHLSPSAREFRAGWIARWGATDVVRGGGVPAVDALELHLDAYPAFRCPLSFEDELRAAREFHLDGVRIAAAGQRATLVTFAWEWDGGTEPSVEPVPGLSPELWGEAMTDADGTEVRLFRTEVSGNDPLLGAVLKQAANGSGLVAVVGPDQEWVVRPREECFAVQSFDSAVIERLNAFGAEFQHRWGLDRVLRPLLDLNKVAELFDQRREAWERRGLRVVMGPHFRTFDGAALSALDEVPSDVTQVDWFMVGIQSPRDQVQLIVHDLGSVEVITSPGSGYADDVEGDDAEQDAIFERRGPMGSIDLAGVADRMDRLAEDLVGGWR